MQEELKNVGVVSRVISKPLHRSHQNNLADNREREIDNNNIIIYRLRNEVELLQRQASPHSKEPASLKIQEAREKLVKTKLKVKELKLRSREVGDTLDSGHDYFEEMKKYERERDAVAARKNNV